MRVSIITAAYNSGESIGRLVKTAMLDSDRHDIDIWLYLHSQHPTTVYMCNILKDYYPLHYFPYGYNRGLALSWNDGLLAAYSNGADVVIIANDDIYFSAGDVDKIATRAINYRQNYAISCAGPHTGLGIFRDTHGYSCVAINPITLETIGCLDENLWPAYMEDLDYHRRATLAGLVEERATDTNVVHQGSATIGNDQLLSLQNMVTQDNNIRYFLKKWQTDDLEAGYKTPFNNPNFNLRIDPEYRHCPYGHGYDRADEYNAFIIREKMKNKIGE